MTNTRTASNFLCILDWMLVLRNIQMYPVFDHIFQFILLINTQKKQFEIVGRESISRITPTKQHINEALWNQFHNLFSSPFHKLHHNFSSFYFMEAAISRTIEGESRNSHSKGYITKLSNVWSYQKYSIHKMYPQNRFLKIMLGLLKE